MNALKLTVFFALCVALAFASQQSNDGDVWVLLVAGSNQYYNYRHQSDVYNAYDLLVNRRGMDASKVIVMQYDDIANSPSNPKPGSVINYPGGPDVYGPNQDKLKDYTGSDVTAANFLKILSGQDMTGVGSGRTIKSGPNDRIFVAFFDHGAEGLIAFPSGGYLYSKDFIATIKDMRTQNKYNEMVFFIEACESGSMFNGLLTDDLKVLGVTASNPYVSSWACDYDDGYKAYLNDCWSNQWMKFSDVNKANSTYTMKNINDDVKVASTKSPQCIYGYAAIQSELLSLYQGLASSSSRPSQPRPQPTDKISSRDVYEQHLLRLRQTSNSSQDQLAIQKEIIQFKQQARKADSIYTSFAKRLNIVLPSSVNDDPDHCFSRTLNHDCIKAATEYHNKACGMYTEYSFRYAGYIASACDQHNAEVIGRTFEDLCVSK